MAGFLALGNDQYLGEFTHAVTAGIENGTFVIVNLATGVASVPAADTDGDGDVYFVANEITTIPEDRIDDINFKVASGKFLRLHIPQKGEILVTTNYKGTPAVGDTLAVGDGGTVEAVAARTPKFKFGVKKVTTAFGTSALELVVL